MAGIVVTAACTDSPKDIGTPVPSPSPDPAVLRDDLHTGLTIEDRGFATFPVRGGDGTRRIVGAAAVFRNNTDEPMRIHIRYRFVDVAGRGWWLAERNDWAAVVSVGLATVPPGQAVEFGDAQQFDVDQAERVAGIVLYVIEGTVRPEPSVLLPARITALKPAATPKDEWDYVSFEVENPGNTLREPDYGMVYRSAGGRLIGGWFGSHALWSDIAKALPAGENERYPQGRSRHTMPAWLPPGIEAGRVSMHVWR
ncbi:MAG TPA: hypothetical protein VN408_15235 [Actinoplanes sp.]|nr:hypothetical protein [Actinoplanes sp.]